MGVYVSKALILFHQNRKRGLQKPFVAVCSWYFVILHTRVQSVWRICFLWDQSSDKLVIFLTLTLDSQNLRIDSQASRLDSWKFRDSRTESRESRHEWLSTYFWAVPYVPPLSCLSRFISFLLTELYILHTLFMIKILGHITILGNLTKILANIHITLVLGDITSGEILQCW